jgi:hypothetical protein
LTIIIVTVRRGDAGVIVDHLGVTVIARAPDDAIDVSSNSSGAVNSVDGQKDGLFAWGMISFIETKKGSSCPVAICQLGSKPPGRIVGCERNGLHPSVPALKVSTGWSVSRQSSSYELGARTGHGRDFADTDPTCCLFSTQKSHGADGRL